ncbi:hypothetical protein K458DRAFT_431357 [Lentithecium fluviatile CBS 122367]|uniref:Ubiquitin 3 binding protein But2 C-terminal domain-containing protein n=1 Tax=Lentithecium fluviatile CBS 122367 TaxID=1168545 RepID=A0A6G1J2F1_9PLEO|nr:hypothetical protein K458DRAFT_431357 [Lentithecium fluviatile CBS 122367]
MKLTALFALALTAMSSTIASPLSRRADTHYLRVNAPNEPYHQRHLVLLPNSYRLGLENFTVHPTTPPVTFTPVRLASGRYALRGTPAASAGASETPYIAVFTAKDGSRPATMGVVLAPGSSKEEIDAEPEACENGFECRADVWTGVDGGKLEYAGKTGTWEPVKEAPEGWVVYWKGAGDGEVYHPITLEIVPV